MDNKLSIKAGDSNPKIETSKGWLKRVWGDPVWSKVIAAPIIGVLTLLFSLIKSAFDEISLRKINVGAIWGAAIHYSIEVYQLLISIGILTSIFVIIVIYRRRKAKRALIAQSFDSEQLIGNFTFRELYNALRTNLLETPTVLRASGWSEKTDLLTLFLVSQQLLNVGVDIDSPGPYATFFYFHAAPNLMSYGLVEMVTTKSQNDKTEIISLRTSPTGYKFFSVVERYRLHNDTILNTTSINNEANQN